MSDFQNGANAYQSDLLLFNSDDIFFLLQVVIFCCRR